MFGCGIFPLLTDLNYQILLQKLPQLPQLQELQEQWDIFLFESPLVPFRLRTSLCSPAQVLSQCATPGV